jgi:hypothetical protein
VLGQVEQQFGLFCHKDKTRMIAMEAQQRLNILHRKNYTVQKSFG